MLGRLDVAVIHVGPGQAVDDLVVVGEGGAHVDGGRGLGHAVEDRRRLGEAVEVDRVRVEQVGAHDHPDVGEGQVELLPFLQVDGGRGIVRRGQSAGPGLPAHGPSVGSTVHDLGRRQSGDVGEAEGVERLAVRHGDEAVAAGQVHALDVRVARTVRERRRCWCRRDTACRWPRWSALRVGRLGQRRQCDRHDTAQNRRACSSMHTLSFVIRRYCHFPKRKRKKGAHALEA